MIRMDTYTRARWHTVPPTSRALIEAAIPAGWVLSVTHGGSRYSAFLYDANGTRVGENRQQARIGSACLGLLHRLEMA
jgi:YD repeat-containing protein